MPLRNPSTACVRCACVRSACSAAALRPPAASRRARRSAPDLVRTNTSTGPSVRRRNFASHSVFCAAATFSMVCVMLLAGPPADPTCTNFASQHDLVGQPHHLFRHRRREEQRLPRGRVGQRRDDAPNVGPEAHVHHAIRFVEHERIELVELHGAVAHVIHQPARRGDDDVDARLERALLRVHRHAAVDGDAGQVRVIGEALDVVFDLAAELARRREDEDAREAALVGRRRARPEHAVQDRQEERRGLARAGVGAADEVAAVHDDRDDRALNRRRAREAADANALDERRLEAERVESDRSRIVLGLRPRDRRRWRRLCASTWRRVPPGRGAPPRPPGRRLRRPRELLRLACMGAQNSDFSSGRGR